MLCFSEWTIASYIYHDPWSAQCALCVSALNTTRQAASHKDAIHRWHMPWEKDSKCLRAAVMLFKMQTIFSFRANHKCYGKWCMHIRVPTDLFGTLTVCPHIQGQMGTCGVCRWQKKNVTTEIVTKATYMELWIVLHLFYISSAQTKDNRWVPHRALGSHNTSKYFLLMAHVRNLVCFLRQTFKTM